MLGNSAISFFSLPASSMMSRQCRLFVHDQSVHERLCAGRIVLPKLRDFHESPKIPSAAFLFVFEIMTLVS